MAKECCTNCTKCLKLKHYDYLEHGVDHLEMDGYVCLIFASEGQAIWITGIDPEEERCEEFSAKENAC